MSETKEALYPDNNNRALQQQLRWNNSAYMRSCVIGSLYVYPLCIREWTSEPLELNKDFLFYKKLWHSGIAECLGNLVTAHGSFISNVSSTLRQRPIACQEISKTHCEWRWFTSWTGNITYFHHVGKCTASQTEWNELKCIKNKPTVHISLKEMFYWEHSTVIWLFPVTLGVNTFRFIY